MSLPGSGPKKPFFKSMALHKVLSRILQKKFTLSFAPMQRTTEGRSLYSHRP